MTLFWISTVILTLIACALVALPLLKQKANNDDILRDELNKAFYKDRLSELQEETEEGLVESQEDLISDLKQSLLDDIPAQKTESGNQSLADGSAYSFCDSYGCVKLRALLQVWRISRCCEMARGYV